MVARRRTLASRLGAPSRRHAVLVVCVVAYFAVRLSEFVVSPVLPQIRAGLSLSPLAVGVSFTASTASYALAQLPSGALGDRLGPRRVVLWTLLATTLGSLTLAVAPSGWAFVAGFTLLGAVGGAYYAPATALLAERFDATGSAIGVHRLGAQVVGLTAPLVALVAVAFGWRIAVGLGAVATLPAAAGIALVVRTRTTPTGGAETDPTTGAGTDAAPLGERLAPGRLRELLSRPPVAFTTIVAGLAQFVDTATFSFLPTILQEFHGLRPTVANLLFVGYFAAMTVAQPVAGWASDRAGRDVTAVGALCVGVAGYLVLLGGDGRVVLATGAALVGVGMGWGPPIQSRALDSLDADEQGAGFGLVRTAYIGIASLCGVAVGGAVGAGGWPLAMAMLAGVFGLAALSLVGNRVAGTGF